MDKPHVLICSSSRATPIAQGAKQNLERDFLVTIWTEDFFNEHNVTALNTFLKKLMRFDAAVIVLAPDDQQVNVATEEKYFVPRDNVIFELGAAMARMGIRKTFVLAPDQPKLKLPTYFKGLEPLTYIQDKNGNFVSATGTASTQIRNQLNRLEQDVFHSDLPAVGLAYGYFSNFLLPVYNSLRERKCLHLPEGEKSWELDDGFAVIVVVPDSPLNRASADKILVEQFRVTEAAVTMRDGRNLSAYLLPRTKDNSPLNIIDIPTTLLTSAEVITRVDNFWGAGDIEFKEALASREIAAFARRIRGLIKENQLPSEKLSVISLGDALTRFSKG
jgi:CAP12/Pycsar effector protein, TIR domain/Prokaryotic STING domain